ncbi:hypothetical protein L211DRAFT_889740 [Terfezia boudieri ATCC MYA-4762]|uniref:PQ loop repeat protein n=1 Tax=Terfezia boudieri ATCC MYA-4762 TaxID=1051890 RepID=A0A3N4LU46_9PEZI|nr:hypothetical protein L211DRAFT_889740 [Terfezia boudieri ATCC MYA-4762]
MATVFDTLLSGGSPHPPPTIPPSACTSLENPSWANLLSSLCILFGIIGSYIPQHHRIISRQSSEGISPFFLLLGCTSGTGTLLNILILSKNVLGCCWYIGGFNCFAAGLGVAQVGTQWACFVVIILLFMIYVPRDAESLERASPPLRSWKNPFSNTHPTASTALIVTFTCLVHFVVHLIFAFYITAIRPNSLVSYANFLGVQATILASVQYIPQILTTWKLGHVGSLSIPMMCIQTPGSFVWAISLAMREGTAWSSWITYVVTGNLQGCLLVMCVMFGIQERRSKAKGMGTVVNGAPSRYGAVDTSRREQGEYGNGDEEEERPLLEGNRMT